MPILIPNETSALDAASPALKTSAHKANFFIFVLAAHCAAEEADAMMDF